MIRNNIKTILRSVRHRKMMSAINILSLSIGISSALVIFMVVYYEFSYDRFEPDRDRIYRVVLDANFNGSEGHSAAVMAPLGPAVRKELAGIEETAPVMQFQGDGTARVRINRGEAAALEIRKQDNIVFTNADYFHIVPFRWLAGSASTALKEPFSVVLTRSRGKEYFPSLSPSEIVGKQISYNNEITATVTGVVDNLNENTDFQALEFISYPTISASRLKDRFMTDVWNDWMAYSKLYIKLSAGYPVAVAEKQVNQLLLKYNPDAARQKGHFLRLHLQVLREVHFDTRYSSFGQRIADLPTLYALMAVAAFLLILGCINFINLNTAEASQRAREIGIRKTLGSSRKQLVFRFLGETFVIAGLASLLALVLLPLLLKLFREYIPPGLRFNPFHQPYIYVFLIGLSAIVSLIAGMYPAWILSGYRPVSVLKNISVVQPGETRHAWVRKTLTVSQFAIAQFFIMATVIVAKQIYYSLNSDLGFRKDAILKFETPFERKGNHEAELVNLLNQIPEIKMVSRGFLSPADEGVAFTNITYEGKKDLQANIQIRWGDPAFLDLYGIKLIAGRKPMPSDSMREFVINNTYAHLLGFAKPQEAIGQFLGFNGKRLPIVGVMNDFHDQSMRAPISPLVFSASSGSFLHVLLKPNTEPGTWHRALSKIKEAFNRVYPDAGFNYSFVDDMIGKMYGNEEKMAGLMNWATVLSIVISCLGLLGMVSFTINTRRKEIGIRKILGAGVTGIVKILSGGLLRLVLLAYLIATPVAWWASNRWLSDYAYRTTLSWWVFVGSGLGLGMIAILTLSIQTIRAAKANPVESLRTE